VLLLRPNNFGNGCEAVRLCLPGDGRVGEPGIPFGARGSALLLFALLVELLLPR